MALGAIEAALSSASTKEGVRILGNAATFMDEMRLRSIFVSVSQISGIERPQMEGWKAVVEGKEFSPLNEIFLEVKDDRGSQLFIRWDSIDLYKYEA